LPFFTVPVLALCAKRREKSRMATTKQRKTRKAPARSKPPAHKPSPDGAHGEPILDREDVRTILFDLATKLAPGDVTSLIERESDLRSQAAAMKEEDLSLLRAQIGLALDCLSDHVAGECPQIPYYTISLLAAGVYYFGDQLDVIPDFLPHIGRLDDAMVMAMACQLAADGLQRYCDWKGRPLPAFAHPPATR
jgi:uncharacterized membrane protein YkvA (DUF1232 family)